ncbi:hypothetical protein [Psychrobacter sp.]|uniref:hypothetical protein n=1 Tax=Psychrobacter sp. TaxID=56811 RepID=UPI002649DBFA|nr:hypothetical protein [Psychrobacter sp.]MDN6276529.1 hypothetical protein [Psychrobacter sp.]MDN6307780.1 hypothetical protein [Psychrobacter sp.]
MAVATRLPIVELHYVIVLGIEFISDNEATFIDLDLWIQPVHTMTQRERQLTKKIQQLKQQNARQQVEQEKKEQAVSKKETASQITDAGHQSQAWPKVSRNLSIPTRKNKA